MQHVENSWIQNAPPLIFKQILLIIGQKPYLTTYQGGATNRWKNEHISLCKFRVLVCWWTNQDYIRLEGGVPCKLRSPRLPGGPPSTSEMRGGFEILLFYWNFGCHPTLFEKKGGRFSILSTKNSGNKIKQFRKHISAIFCVGPKSSPSWGTLGGGQLRVLEGWGLLTFYTIYT